MRVRRIGSIAIVVLAWPAVLAARQQIGNGVEPAPPAKAGDALVVNAVRVVDRAPLIDGHLDEAVWSRAQPVTDFVQFVPSSGSPASERTEARVVYDEDAIYVGMRMYDRDPEGIAAQLGRRDASDIYSDWAHVVIDSYSDRRTGFRFSVNPVGVQKDVLHFDDTNEDLGWDAVWDVATQVDSLGWTAEFRIPFSQLRYSEQSSAQEVTWGINFGRVIARLGEQSYWAPVLQDVQGFVSRAGELRGLVDLAAPSRLEVVPYTLARATRAPGEAADPFYDPTAYFGSLGADVKYGVTSNLTLTAALNPDFGQVESDPSQVNLTAFETFFGERRPFFTEGGDIFRFRLGFGDGDGSDEQLFYSRRIGRAPQGELPDDAEYAEMPEATTILGAAKLSGKTASGWSIGVLNALTAEERAPTAGGVGGTGDVVVEPLTDYAVTRVMKDFRDGESAVGAVLTATHRRLDGTSLDFLRSAAYAGGVDFRHRFAEGRYEVTAKLLGSYIRGSEEAITRVQEAAGHYFQRPDADHVEFDPTRTSLAGAAAMLNLGKYGGGHWRWAAGGSARSPGFEVNDLGYQREADVADQFIWVGYRQFRPGSVFRVWNANFNQWTGWSFGGERLSTGANVNGSFQFLNYWGGYGGINHNVSALSVGALRGGPAIMRPGMTNLWFGLYTDQRKPVNVSLGAFGYREQASGGGNFSLSPSVRVRPSSRLEFSLGPGITWSHPAWQYVTRADAGDGSHYIFAKLEQKTVSLTTRLSYTFTPTLSLQLYAQPFVSAGDYFDFMEVADPRADRFDDRFSRFGTPGICPDAGTAGTICLATAQDDSRAYRVDLGGAGTTDFSFDDPDFNFKELRSNVVLRWEYRPGSTLYAVWSQGRSDYESIGTFDLGRDTGRLFDAEGTNVFMIKASYWLNW